MDDVTDTVFRQIVTNTATPDIFFTEFVNVDGLQSPGREKLLHKLQFTSSERPIIAQIWGKTPENYYKTTQDLINMGFDGVDINMGCPVKTVVKDGCCIALADNRELAHQIIVAVQEAAAGKIPVSVKTRLGNREVDETWTEFLLGHKLDALTIHGRTAKQMSKVPADWSKIEQVRAQRDALSPATLLIGNGDVTDRKHGAELAAKHGLDGIMIGRGIFADPFAFSVDSPWQGMSPQEKIALYKKHVLLFKETWKHRERRPQVLNKFCKIYVHGFDGAKELRDRLMHAETVDELITLLDTSAANPSQPSLR